ncbi:MAG: XRE family transcriptional regulator [Ruthenibacterium sp.]
MNEKSTENLLESLRQHPQAEQAVTTAKGSYVCETLPQALAAFLQRKHITKADAIRCSMLNNIYAHQIFSGLKTPSRDKLLLLGFGMNLTFDEMQTLLKRQGYAQLYAKMSRDAFIIHAFLHTTPILELNTQLYEHELKTLL